MKRALLAAALSLIAVPAGAQSSDSYPYKLYQAGQYDAAIRAGIAAGDADGYTQAAHAVLAKTRIAGTPCLACLQTAESYERKAIALDPTLPAPRVYLSATLGYESRIIGLVQAKLKGYAGEAKSNLDVAYKNHPDDGYTLAALGGWNLGVVNGGGAFLADMMYGATTDKGISFYEKAFKAEPDNIVIRFQYALSLSALDHDKYGHAIEDSLAFAVNGHPHTAFEKYMQGEAKDLLALWQRHDWPDYQKQMRKIQGYPD